MGKKFYRFRRMESLIGSDRQELEKQIIYFAAPHELNDPMEGFRDVYWSGDLIVWKNLFRHYLLCLERLFSLIALCGADHDISADNMPIFSCAENFPTETYKKIFQSMCSSFFENNALAELVKQISERSTAVRRNELSFYLRAVHPFAFETIYMHYEKNGLISQRVQKYENSDTSIIKLIECNYISNLEKSLEENRQLSDIAALIQKDFFHQIDLISAYKSMSSESKKGLDFILSDFVDEYLAKLEKLVFPDWYTACFMTECKNSSVWGHYGDNHSGACLIFESDDTNEGQSIMLNVKSSYSSKGYGYSFFPFKFHQIDYENGFGEIDFFRMLGRLPISQLNSTWYMFDGELSECGKHLTTSNTLWKENYWEKFYPDITKKSKDWSYENEYRLILTGLFIDPSNKKDRVLNYKFSSLKGIIFGIKTKKEEKLEVIKIIEKKCKENNIYDFKFYQAYYCHTNKSILHSELSLLKFESE